MIQANELRIGNNILLLGEVCTIECISNLPKRKEMYWIKTKEFIDTKIIHFKPIPLTEEILLKCGAKKTDKEDSFGGFIIYYPNGNGMRIKNNEWSNQHITVKIEFLHQLQNLYFALTNEELTFNNL